MAASGALRMFAIAEEAVGAAIGERSRPNVGTTTGGVVVCVLLALGLSLLIQIV